MPRSNGIYSPPPGTGGTPQTVISSAMFNAWVADISADQNNPRPIIAGGTGSATSQGAIDAFFDAPRTIQDERLLLVDPSDPTKRVRLDAGNVATAQTRVLTMADQNVNLATVLSDIAALAASNPLRGHLFGLTLSNNATDPTNDIDIAAGSAGSDGTTPVLMTLPSALTKRLDAAWTVGAGNGGLDTGSIADTTYHVWLIQRTDTGVVDALFSASATSPTMPANYDRKRRIGAVIRESGALVAFDQYGKTFKRRNPVQSVSDGALGATAKTGTLAVPTGIKVDAIITGTFLASGATANILYVSSLDQPDNAPSATNFTSQNRNTTNVGYSANIVTNASGQFRYRADAGSGHAFSAIVLGWVDYSL